MCSWFSCQVLKHCTLLIDQWKCLAGSCGICETGFWKHWYSCALTCQWARGVVFSSIFYLCWCLIIIMELNYLTCHMQVSKPLLETSRYGYLAAISASSYSFISLLKHFVPIMNPGTYWWIAFIVFSLTLSSSSPFLWSLFCPEISLLSLLFWIKKVFMLSEFRALK